MKTNRLKSVVSALIVVAGAGLASGEAFAAAPPTCPRDSAWQLVEGAFNCYTFADQNNHVQYRAQLGQWVTWDKEKWKTELDICNAGTRPETVDACQEAQSIATACKTQPKDTKLGPKMLRVCINTGVWSEEATLSVVQIWEFTKYALGHQEDIESCFSVATQFKLKDGKKVNDIRSVADSMQVEEHALKKALDRNTEMLDKVRLLPQFQGLPKDVLKDAIGATNVEYLRCLGKTNDPNDDVCNGKYLAINNTRATHNNRLLIATAEEGLSTYKACYSFLADTIAFFGAQKTPLPVAETEQRQVLLELISKTKGMNTAKTRLEKMKKYQE